MHGQKSNWLVIWALVCAAGTWIYTSRVLIPYQTADAAVHSRPRGNLSDLYPSWVAARELLLHGRDPYSAEVTREIQAGYYGRPLDPTRPGDPRDQQGFAYPLYEVFLLAPAAPLPFPLVQRGFFWMLAVLTTASVWAWLRVLRWSASPAARIAAITLTLGSFAAMQGLKLQQISLLVAPLMAFAILLLSKEHPMPAGVLLALACIKPQLVVFLLVWLVIWTLGDWRRRYRWAASFLLTLGLLLAASEWWLPHWISRFWQQARAYRYYADAVSIAEKMLGPVLGWSLDLLVLAAMLCLCWRERRQAVHTSAFAFTTAMVLAVTILLVPKYAPYNQVLLMPALLALVQRRSIIWQESWRARVLLAITAVLLFWPWFTCVVLASLSFVLPQQTVGRFWMVPSWTVVGLPIGVAAAMLVCAWRLPFAASDEASTS